MKRAALTVFLGLPLAVLTWLLAFGFVADRPEAVEPPPLAAFFLHPYVTIPLLLAAVWWISGLLFRDER